MHQGATSGSWRLCQNENGRRRRHLLTRDRPPRAQIPTPSAERCPLASRAHQRRGGGSRPPGCVQLPLQAAPPFRIRTECEWRRRKQSAPDSVRTEARAGAGSCGTGEAPSAAAGWVLRPKVAGHWARGFWLRTDCHRRASLSLTLAMLWRCGARSPNTQGRHCSLRVSGGRTPRLIVIQ